MFRTPIRRALSTATRSSLKIGLIPADGIGKEVIPAAQKAIEALGSDIPKPEFIPLEAGFEYFTRHGEALPEDTVRYITSSFLHTRANSQPSYSALKACDCALFGSVRYPNRFIC